MDRRPLTSPRPRPASSHSRVRCAGLALFLLAAAAVLPACRTVPSYSPFDPPRYAEPTLEDFAVLLYLFDWVGK